MRVPRKIEQELDHTGLPWEVVKGGHHAKIKLNGKFVGILPWKPSGCIEGRAMNNIIAQIRRAARGVQT